MKRILFLAGVLWLAAGFALADDRPSEEEMFGGSPSGTPTATPAAGTAPAPKDAAGMDLKPHSLLTEAEQNTQIGGTLSTEADYYLQKGIPLTQDLISNPNILFLYMDTKLENDNRVFARLRTFYDPTGVSSGNPNVASYVNPYGIGSQTSDNISVQLQELRMSLNIDHRIFFTIGRQKVKYGAAKFFNPTDFLNNELYDFFLPSDERTGVDMVMAQVPSGTANLYAVGLPGNPGYGNPAGGYFRGEFGYDSLAGILESGEISLSGFLPKGQPGKAGFDISQGVGDVDAYFEGALEELSDDNWQGAYSVGADWQTRYSDRQTDTVTFEGEFSDFPYPVTTPEGVVLTYSATQFGTFAIDLANPAGWTDLSFVETNIYDFSYQSGFSRLDAVCQFTDRVTGRVYVSAPWGSSGFFSLPGPALLAQTGARLDVNF
jgi:hypothetical protein